MVTNVTSLTGNGLRDWLIQRFSALFLMSYTLFMLGYFLSHRGLDYATWHQLFECQLVQLGTLLALFMILLHAWVGIWTVLTDYVQCTVLRLTLQGVVGTVLFIEVLWGFMIVWGQ